MVVYLFSFICQQYCNGGIPDSDILPDRLFTFLRYTTSHKYSPDVVEVLMVIQNIMIC